MIQHSKKFLHTHQVFQLGGKLHFRNRQLPSSKVLKEEQDLEFHAVLRIQFDRNDICRPLQNTPSRCFCSYRSEFPGYCLMICLFPGVLLLLHPFFTLSNQLRPSLYVCLQAFRSALCSSVSKDFHLNLQTPDKLKTQASGCSLLGGHPSLEAQSNDVAPHLKPRGDVTCGASPIQQQ